MSDAAGPDRPPAEWESLAAPPPEAGKYRERRQGAALQTGNGWVVAAGWLMFLTIAGVSLVQLWDTWGMARQAGTPVTVQQWSHLLDPRSSAYQREKDVARAVLVVGGYLMLCWLGMALWGISRCAKVPLPGARASLLGSAVLLSAGITVATSLKPLYALLLPMPLGILAQRESVMNENKEYWAWIIEALLLLALVLALSAVGCFQRFLGQVASRCQDQGLARRLSWSFLLALIAQACVLAIPWLLSLWLQLGPADYRQRARSLSLRGDVTILGLLLWLIVTGVLLGYGTYLVTMVNAAVRRSGVISSAGPAP